MCHQHKLAEVHHRHHFFHRLSVRLSSLIVLVCFSGWHVWSLQHWSLYSLTYVNVFFVHCPLLLCILFMGFVFVGRFGCMIFSWVRLHLYLKVHECFDWRLQSRNLCNYANAEVQVWQLHCRNIDHFSWKFEAVKTAKEWQA